MRYAHSAWVQHDLKTLAAIGTTIGTSSHLLYWMHGLRAPHSAQIFWFHVAAFCLITALSAFSHGLANGIMAASAICWSYLAGVFASMAIYRIWFHRLSRFPGPLASKVSKMHAVWRARHLNAHNDAVAWHDKYGDFVRTGTSTIFHVFFDPVSDNPVPRTDGPHGLLSRGGSEGHGR